MAPFDFASGPFCIESETELTKSLLCKYKWQMPEYRAHIIRTDGQFLGALKLICSDDASAKEYAKQLVDGHDIELWQGERRIERFNHTNRIETKTPPICSKCAGAPKYFTTVLNSHQWGDIHHIFKCDCGEVIWVSGLGWQQQGRL